MNSTIFYRDRRKPQHRPAHLNSLTEVPAERLRRVINNAIRGAERARRSLSTYWSFRGKSRPIRSPQHQQARPWVLRFPAPHAGGNDQPRYRWSGWTVVGESRSGPARGCHPQSRGERPRCHGRRREADDHDQKYLPRQEVLPAIRRARSRTIRANCHQRHGHGNVEGLLKRVFEPFFTTRSLDKERALGSAKSIASSSNRGDTSRSTVKRARARPSCSTCPPCPQTCARNIRSSGRSPTPIAPDDFARRRRSRCPCLCGRDPSRALPSAGYAQRGFGAQHDRSQRRAGGPASSRPRLARNERTPARRAAEGTPAAGESLVHDRLFA